jgi:tryptophan-rich sensory protein
MIDTLLANNGRPLIVAVLVVTVLAVAGARLTDIGPWYFALKKPSWQPPDWLFGPAWTLIFALTAAAAAIAWNAAETAQMRRALEVAFLVNAVLNVAWSWLFFTLRRPDFALIEVGVFWASIVVLIVLAGRVSSTAGLLLVPYLAWVSFASFLNWTIVRLNAPFGA